MHHSHGPDRKKHVRELYYVHSQLSFTNHLFYFFSIWCGMFARLKITPGSFIQPYTSKKIA